MAKADIMGSAGDFIRAVTNFVFVRHELAPADVIFVPGSAEPEHALHAARVYKADYAPWVLPSGRYSIGMGHFAGVRQDVRHLYPDAYDTEWAFLRDVLQKSGVPKSAILKEDRATYTWENALFSRAVTDGMGLEIRRAILCCKPFHARRAMLYYKAAFPEADILVSPCVWQGADRDDWYLTRQGQDMVLGEVRRLGDQVNDVFAAMVQHNDFSG